MLAAADWSPTGCLFWQWVPFNSSTTPPTAHWDGLLGAELYDFTAQDNISNVHESVNLVARPALAATVKALHQQLVQGWRAAAPQQL